MIAVTTFSKSGYETYARKMVQSVVEKWPTKLIIYTEFPLEICNEKIEVRDLFDIPHLQSFLTYLKGVPKAFGKMNEGYDYNFDIWRFCRKLFAQYDVLQNYQGKVFWLDADLYIRQTITEQWLNDLFTVEVHEDGPMVQRPLVYLGREGLYTETGFIGFDTEGKDFDKFLSNYIGCLRTGKVFTLPRWHDCQVFDWAREVSAIEGVNLSTFFKIPEDRKMKRSDLDVVNRSVLKDHIIHYKGNRKKKMSRFS